MERHIARWAYLVRHAPRTPDHIDGMPTFVQVAS